MNVPTRRTLWTLLLVVTIPCVFALDIYYQETKYSKKLKLCKRWSFPNLNLSPTLLSPHCLAKNSFTSFPIVLGRAVFQSKKWVMSYIIKIGDKINKALNHFSPLSHFYTPWKVHKTSGFLRFLGGIERWHWTKMG